jgi:hypothetical protein
MNERPTSHHFQIRSLDMHENRFAANDSGADGLAFFFRVTPSTDFE